MATDIANWIGVTLSAGRYRVTAKLGEGGMGAIYQAEDETLGRPVVVKVPHPAVMADPEFAARFSREIRALVRLDHPHVVKVLDVGEQFGLPYAVMQYLSGGSLADRVAKGPGQSRQMPLSLMARWLPGIAEALDFLHAKGFVHRDVKPANILFDGHGNPFLADFGIVKVMASTEGKRTASLTLSGMVVGTPEYMAPELIMGEPCDGRVDQYALGILAYQWLGGQLPFTSPTPTGFFIKHTTEMPRPLHEMVPSIAREVSGAIGRALSKDPRERFPTCADFARTLCATGQSGATSAAPVSPAFEGRQVVQCPGCQKTFKVPPEALSKKLRCPVCQTSFRQPQATQPTAPIAGITPPAAIAAPAASSAAIAAAQPIAPQGASESPPIALPVAVAQPIAQQGAAEVPPPDIWLIPKTVLAAVIGAAAGAALGVGGILVREANWFFTGLFLAVGFGFGIGAGICAALRSPNWSAGQLAALGCSGAVVGAGAGLVSEGLGHVLLYPYGPFFALLIFCAILGVMLGWSVDLSWKSAVTGLVIGILAGELLGAASSFVNPFLTGLLGAIIAAAWNLAKHRLLRVPPFCLALGGIVCVIISIVCLVLLPAAYPPVIEIGQFSEVTVPDYPWNASRRIQVDVSRKFLRHDIQLRVAEMPTGWKAVPTSVKVDKNSNSVEIELQPDPKLGATSGRVRLVASAGNVTTERSFDVRINPNWEARFPKSPLPGKTGKIPSPAGTNVVFGLDGVYRSNSSLTLFDPTMQFKIGAEKKRHKQYQIAMRAGRQYQIDLRSDAFDSYLYLIDNSSNVIVAIDDDGGGFPHARIVFTAPRDNVYRIHVTTFNAGTGSYELTVREL